MEIVRSICHENLFWKEGVPLPSKIKSILTKLFTKKYLTRGKKEGLSRKSKSIENDISIDISTFLKH